ncbi:NAD(P)/FAD-dependent oxidoreductase [Thioclava sp. GXIMD4215]|uniref:NAD(P)/FAD-dependent oxidoreductase n=1 Tax=Thioclava sp. GXIMD4215 TaxID=3131928 RepID=UPI0032478F59
MSLDVSANPQIRPRIAIIGGGISGLSAAWMLNPRYDVTLYEAEARLGGHARTVFAGRSGQQPVDTGFIVFNYANYPHLTRLFHDLEVPVIRSDMSFGATIDAGRIEYALRDLRGLTAQRRNLLRPGFLRMVRDILAFNARAAEVAMREDLTVDELIAQMGLGQWFRDYYLLPISGAIWSTPSQEIGMFPARSLIRFFENHALLSATGQHQWWTVKGGSAQYVARLEQALRQRGVALRLQSGVASVKRHAGGVTVNCAGALPETFDHVVMACHSDQALRLLADADPEEQALLSAIRYRPNEMVLHADPVAMPKRRACWSSWVYQADHRQAETRLGVSYWMNRLQQIPEEDPLFVSLNPQFELDERRVYDSATFAHPVFDRAALRAQAGIAARQGARNTWFAGAWLRHGFHEDGIASAMRVARRLLPLADASQMDGFGAVA